MRSYLDYRVSIVGDDYVRVRYVPLHDSESGASGLIDKDELHKASLLSQKVATGEATPDEIRDLGRNLWNALFSSETGTHFLEVFRKIQQMDDVGLRVRLEIDEINALREAHLPWEFIRYPGNAYNPPFQFATHPSLIISRYRSLYEVANAIELGNNEKLRILVAVASPENLPVVDYKPVWNHIRNYPSQDPIFDAPHIIEQTTPQALDESLRRLRPHIVHIMAHGQFDGHDGRIALLDRDGRSTRWYGATDLASLFETWTPGLVLLHSCNSAQNSQDEAFVGLASRIVHGNVPMVVAMRYAVTNRTAVEFSREFYTHLAGGEPVDAAVQLGRRAIGRDFGFDKRDYAVPTLFMRVPNGRFFFRHQEQSNSETVSLHSNSETARDPAGIFHNLPQPTYGVFVGRDAELVKLHNFIYAEGGRHLFCVIGPGGVGKTSLVLEASHRALRRSAKVARTAPDVIIWATARTEQLTSSGVISIAPPVNTLEDIYTIIAITLKRRDILRAPREEQDELIKQALIERKSLIIVDNFETVDDNRVFNFLDSLPKPTKVIVTSRYDVDCPTSIRLSELKGRDGLAFVSTEAQEKEVSLTKEQSERLLEVSCGLPLAIVWSIAQISCGFTFETTVHLLKDAGGDVIKFCFGRATNSIRNSDAYYALLALALFLKDASYEAIGYVGGLEHDIVRRDSSIVALKKLGLIDQDASRFKMLPITKRLIESEFVLQSQFVDSARAKQTDYYLKFLHKNNPKQEPTPPTAPFWEEAENIQGLVRWHRSHGNANELASLACAYAPFLWMHGLWPELFEITNWINETIRLTNEWSTLADLNLHTILAYMDQSKPEAMLEHLALVEQAFKNMPEVSDELKETYLFARGAAATLMNDPSARELLEEALAFGRRMGVHWRIAGTLYWLGIRAYNRQEWSFAKEYFEQSLVVAEEHNDKRSMGLAYAYLPEVYYRLHEVQKAFQTYESVSQFVEIYGQATSKGLLSLGIGKVLLETSHFKEALLQFQRALDVFSELRRHDAIQECKQLIAEAQQQIRS